MYLFMTGYPGFIATRLVRALTRRQKFEKIYLLVLDDPKQHWLKQAETDVKIHLADLPIQLVKGDITKRHLGIHDKEVLEALKTNPGEWWHLAAVYRLDVGEEVAKLVNIEGTRRVLQLAKQCQQLKRLHYVSTAYVSGAREGVVKEEDLWPAPHPFKNFYESTKNAAEVLVRAEMPALPVTIYRYAVVVGDALSGETAKFDGPYFLMNFLQRWGKIPMPHVGPMTSRFNTIPVSFAVEASAAIAARSDTVGHCYHVVDPQPWTAGEIYRRIATELGCPRPRGQIPASLILMLARLQTVCSLLGFPAEAVTYMNHGANYNCAQAQAILAQEGVQCPDVGDYIGTLVAWYLNNRHRPELQVH